MPVTLRSATLADVPSILAIEQPCPSAAHWTTDEYQRRVESGFVLLAEEARKDLRICLRESGGGRVGDRECRGRGRSSAGAEWA